MRRCAPEALDARMAFERIRQQRRVVTVGRRGYDRERDAPGVDDHRAFDSPFSAIHRARTRLLASAGDFRYAAVTTTSESLENSPNDEALHARSSSGAFPIGANSYPVAVVPIVRQSEPRKTVANVVGTVPVLRLPHSGSP